MTNEECVKILRQVKDGDLLTFDKSRRKALDMAIEIMGNIPTQMSGTSGSDINVGTNDLISRQAAIEAQERIMSDHPLDGYEDERLLINALKDLPSAQPDIIHCKDCIHWMPHTQLGRDEDDDEYHDYCARLVPEDEYYAFTRDEDDFCSRAKRKEMANDSD